MNTKTCALEQSNHTKKFMYAFGTVMIMIMMMAICAFAAGAGESIQNGINTGALQIWNILKAVVGPIGGALFAWNGVKALFGGEKGMEQAKKNMLIIVIVMVIVFGAGVIISQVQGWFKDTGAGVFNGITGM